MTERQPERFAQLALRFPTTVNASFFEALLRGLQKTKPPNHLPAERHASWSPASGEALGRVLRLPQIREKPELATSMAWVVHNHAQNDWSPEIIGDLLHHAMHHADPRPGTLNVGSQQANRWDADTLDENILNSTRSVMAYTIASILFAHQKAGMLRTLRPGIEALTDDPHPVVRAASTAACRAALDIDAEQAISWFFQACDTAIPAMLACRDVRSFLYYQARWGHFDRMQPVMIRMIESEAGEVAQAGAEHITSCYLYEQSSRNPEYEAIHQECLDVWDQLIENRVGLALELTSALDKV